MIFFNSFKRFHAILAHLSFAIIVCVLPVSSQQSFVYGATYNCSDLLLSRDQSADSRSILEEKIISNFIRNLPGISIDLKGRSQIQELSTNEYTGPVLKISIGDENAVVVRLAVSKKDKLTNNLVDLNFESFASAFVNSFFSSQVRAVGVTSLRSDEGRPLINFINQKTSLALDYSNFSHNQIIANVSVYYPQMHDFFSRGDAQLKTLDYFYSLFDSVFSKRFIQDHDLNRFSYRSRFESVSAQRLKEWFKYLSSEQKENLYDDIYFILRAEVEQQKDPSLEISKRQRLCLELFRQATPEKLLDFILNPKLDLSIFDFTDFEAVFFKKLPFETKKAISAYWVSMSVLGILDAHSNNFLVSDKPQVRSGSRFSAALIVDMAYRSFIFDQGSPVLSSSSHQSPVWGTGLTEKMRDLIISEMPNSVYESLIQLNSEQILDLAKKLKYPLEMTALDGILARRDAIIQIYNNKYKR